MKRYPGVAEAVAKLLVEEGFAIFCFDASLGGKYPVLCVVLFNPNNGTCFASFGTHPDFGVALERTVTELLQGRSLQDLDVFNIRQHLRQHLMVMMRLQNRLIWKPILSIQAV